MELSRVFQLPSIQIYIALEQDMMLGKKSPLQYSQREGRFYNLLRKFNKDKSAVYFKKTASTFIMAARSIIEDNRIMSFHLSNTPEKNI